MRGPGPRGGRRDHRLLRPSPLRVEWKYILFNFNDGDEEIREVAYLAAKLGVDLRFCLTYSPLRSARFTTLAELRAALGLLAPRASRAMTFQLKPGGSSAEAGEVVGERVEALLLAALEAYRAGHGGHGAQLVTEALALDPGLECGTGDGQAFMAHLQRILDEAAFPSTLSALGNIAIELGEWRVAERLLTTYLARAPEATDRGEVRGTVAELVGKRVEALLLAALDAFKAADAERGAALVAEALALVPGLGPELRHGGDGRAFVRWLDGILAGKVRPAALSVLGNIALELGEWQAAERLLVAFLERAPQAPNRGSVEQTVASLVVGNRLGCALNEAWAVDPERLVRAEEALLAVDPGVARAEVEPAPGHRLRGDDLLPIAEDCRHPSTLATLAYLRWIQDDVPTARVLHERFRERGAGTAWHPPWVEELERLWSEPVRGRSTPKTLGERPPTLLHRLLGPVRQRR